MRRGQLDESVLGWLFWILFFVCAVASVGYLFYRLQT